MRRRLLNWRAGLFWRLPMRWAWVVNLLCWVRWHDWKYHTCDDDQRIRSCRDCGRWQEQHLETVQGINRLTGAPVRLTEWTAWASYEPEPEPVEW